MKIVARIDSGRLLVEMTEREVANVVGYNYEWQMPHERRLEDAFRSGTEYKVCAAWQRLQEQAAAAYRLESVAKTLAALSDLVTQTKVQFTNATAETSKTEGGAA